MEQRLSQNNEQSRFNALQTLASRLSFVTPGLLLVMLLSLILFTTNLVLPLGNKPIGYMTQPALLLFIWAMTGYLFITTFGAKPSNKPTKGVFKRIKYWLISVYFRFIVLLFIGLTLAVIVFSVRFAKLFFS